MLSPEEKRAKARDKARRYRERKRLAKLGQTVLPPTEPGAEGDAAASPLEFTMINSVNLAVDAMKWLQPSDFALVDLARQTAMAMDRVLAEDPNSPKAATWGNLLKQTLHELGGTPTVRLQHELRSMRLVPPLPEDPNSGDEDADTLPVNTGGRQSKAAKRRSDATVTSIKRPPKRRSTAG